MLVQRPALVGGDEEPVLHVLHAGVRRERPHQGRTEAAPLVADLDRERRRRLGLGQEQLHLVLGEVERVARAQREARARALPLRTWYLRLASLYGPEQPWLVPAAGPVLGGIALLAASRLSSSPWVAASVLLIIVLSAMGWIGLHFTLPRSEETLLAVLVATLSGPAVGLVLAAFLLPSLRERRWAWAFVAALVLAAVQRGQRVAFHVQAYPDRTFDVGIAEQHAATSAAGLAMGGLHPVVAIYATFLSRAFDQVRARTQEFFTQQAAQRGENQQRKEAQRAVRWTTYRTQRALAPSRLAQVARKHWLHAFHRAVYAAAVGRRRLRAAAFETRSATVRQLGFVRRAARRLRYEAAMLTHRLGLRGRS